MSIPPDVLAPVAADDAAFYTVIGRKSVGHYRWRRREWARKARFQRGVRLQGLVFAFHSVRRDF